MKIKHTNCVPKANCNLTKKYDKWIPCSYIATFFDEIAPKFLDQFVGNERRNYLEKYFYSIDPRNSLGYSSDESYLKTHDLTKNDIISNSIGYVFNTLEVDDYNDLVDCFTQLICSQKVKVIKGTGLAIYKEIIDVLSYIKQIQTLLRKYPLQYSEHKGSAHSSKYKTLVNTQINQLTNRLEHTYFPLKDQAEIDYTRSMIDLLKSSLEERTKNIPDGLNFINIFFGLDSKILGFDEKELILYKDFMNFYNGIKTEKIELIQSVALYTSTLFKKSELEDRKKAELIRRILDVFFFEEIVIYNTTPKNNQTFVFNAKKLMVPIRTKTIFHNVPIYAYSHKNSNNFLLELALTGIHFILGMNNNLDSDIPVQQEVSAFTSLRGLAEFKRESGFGNKELKIFNYFIEHVA